MHDFDRPLNEYGFESTPDSDPALETLDLSDEAGLDSLSDEAGVDSLFESLETSDFGESQDSGLFEESPDSDQEISLDEADEMALAAELLEVQDEAQMDEFLKKVVRRVGRRLPRLIRTVARVARPLTPLLRQVARQAIPWAARAAGTYFGGPAGAALASRLAQIGMQQFGLEMEGLTPEDQQYEISRRFVRFAANAVSNAVRQAPGAADLRPVLRTAIVQAARRHMPGLIGAVPPGGGFRRRRGSGPAGGTRANARGTWRRFGNRIVLYGIR